MNLRELPLPASRDLFDAACVIALADPQDILDNALALVVYTEMVKHAKGYGDVSIHQKSARILLANIMGVAGEPKN